LTPSGELDFGNALYLAMASSFVYSNDTGPFLSVLGLDRADLKSKGHTYAVVASDANNIVVAFRGTESPLTADGRKDWLLTNARVHLAPPPAGPLGAAFADLGTSARFHAGFLAALADVWDDVFGALKAASDEKDRPVWITGHSLGGGLAAMAAWACEKLGVDVFRAYTFAAPMFCNLEAVGRYNQRFLTRLFRFVNEDDLIPLLPLSSPLPWKNDYRHVGERVSLGRDPSPRAPAGDLFTKLSDFLSLLAGPLTMATLGGVLWKEFQSRFDAHSLDKGYISRIRTFLPAPSP
jgi:hypothetical protein